MKRIIIPAILALGLSAVSCNKEDDTKITQTLTYNTYSVAVHDNGTTVVAPTTYKVNYDLVAQTAVMNVENLSLGSTTASFATGKMPYRMGYFTINNVDRQVILIAAKDAEAGNVEVEDLRAEFTQACNNNNDSLINKLKGVLEANPLVLPTNNPLNNYACVEYEYGDSWNVRTVWRDMLFTGTTVTEYPGSFGFMSQTITYRVSMNLDDAQNLTADVYFYNAKFADNPNAPTLNFVLKGLPLTFTDKGYRIMARDIDPIMVPENTPNTAFKFNSFLLRSSSDMSGITCSFNVAGIYTGRFSGSSMRLAKNAQ